MLSEEEKKAIERLDRIEVYNTGDGEAIDTVLNLITKLQKENKEKDRYIKNKDKQIDLMAEYIEKVTVDLKVAFGENMLWNRNEIKQYFADLVEKE